jgi:hypothetical protein
MAPAQDATIYGAADLDLSRLRRNAHLLPVPGLVACLAYTITGLRAPWQPILVRDANVVLLWFLLLLGNRAGNDLVSEFEGTPTKSSQAESRPSISEEQRS